MAFKNLNLKKSYNSEKDDLLNDFYIPVLKESKIYKRITGYFSSTAFSLSAEGLSEFIEKGGIMQFITNIQFSPEDYDAIESGTKNANEIIEEYIIESINELHDEMVKNHVKILAWLIATEKLELKIGYIKNKNLGKEILHQKIGILIDGSGEILSFSGSNNESAFGWKYNSEKFKVFKGWESPYDEYVKIDLDDFNELWNDVSEKTKVISFPEAAKKELIKFAPRSEQEFKNIFRKISSSLRFKDIKTNKEGPQLWDYQQEAIKNWANNNYKGLLSMATGTGKTITAINGITKLINETKKLGVIIVTPQNTLTSQWIHENLPLFNLNGKEVYGSSKKNLDILANSIIDLDLEEEGYFIIGTTYDTFCSPKFIEEVSKCSSDLCIIADEVHNISLLRRNGLLKKYKFRLGLSATPERYFDYEGSEFIREFFYDTKHPPKKETYEFDLSRAILETNPKTSKTYLTPYEYHIFTAELTGDEYSKFKSYGKKIALAYDKAKETEDFSSYITLLNLRKSIIKSAKNKINVCENILQNMPEIKNKKELKNCLFFLDSEKQILELKKMLNKKFPELVYRTFTSNAFKGKIKEKNKLLQDFKEGHYGVLLSINCFTEGIDIPSTEKAVFLASSTNPKEFIQRRGRVLRRSNEKTKAYIYDIIVLPPKSAIQSKKEDFNTLVQSEIDRAKIFSIDSLNKQDNLKRIKDICDQYNLKNG